MVEVEELDFIENSLLSVTVRKQRTVVFAGARNNASVHRRCEDKNKLV